MCVGAEKKGSDISSTLNKIGPDLICIWNRDTLHDLTSANLCDVVRSYAELWFAYMPRTHRKAHLRNQNIAECPKYSVIVLSVIRSE